MTTPYGQGDSLPPPYMFPLANPYRRQADVTLQLWHATRGQSIYARAKGLADGSW